MIRIPITISPHFVKGQSRGYYLMAQRLFPNGAPILAKKQFVGFWRGGLIVTASHNNEWDSLLKMAINVPTLSFFVAEYSSTIESSVTWLAEAKLWPMPMGFKTFISGRILKPKPDAKKVTDVGVFFWQGMEKQDITILKVPAISADVLLGRKELGE